VVNFKWLRKRNNTYWSTENSHAVHEVPYHDLKVWVWCEIGARMIIGPDFQGTVNSERDVRLILSSFFEQMTDKEKSHGHFMQDNATPHTANNSMDESDEVFREQVISQGLRDHLI
jgi:hypothetical protein